MQAEPARIKLSPRDVFSGSDQLSDRIADLAETNGHVMLDLSEWAGLPVKEYRERLVNAVVSGMRRATLFDAPVLIVNAPDKMHAYLKQTRIDQHLPIFSTPDQAEQALNDPSLASNIHEKMQQLAVRGIESFARLQDIVPLPAGQVEYHTPVH